MTDEQLAEIRGILEEMLGLGGSCQECGMKHKTLLALLDEVERLRKERNEYWMILENRRLANRD